MRKVIIAIVVVVAVIAVGVAIGLFASRSTESPVAHIPADASELTSSVPTPLIPTQHVEIVHHTVPQPVVRTNPVVVQQTVPRPAPVVTANSTNWEDNVDDILASDSDDTNKVKQLLAMFPKLPEDGQVEVAQHLSNLVDDEDYAPLGDLLKNAKLSEDVLDVLMGDVLNRPNAKKLPLLLDIAQNPDHPKAGEAKDLLELYLDKYPVSHEEIDAWLKNNPD